MLYVDVTMGDGAQCYNPRKRSREWQWRAEARVDSLYVGKPNQISLFFWLHHVASGILVPQPGTEPASPALEARSLKTLDHVTSPSQGFPDGGKEKTQKLGVKQTRRTKLPSSEMERNATGAGFGDYQELGV